MTDEATELLKRCEAALTHWVRTYAPEHCSEESVYETRKFMLDQGGTLWFIATLREDILTHLKQADHK